MIGTMPSFLIILCMTMKKMKNADADNTATDVATIRDAANGLSLMSNEELVREALKELQKIKEMMGLL